MSTSRTFRHLCVIALTLLGCGVAAAAPRTVSAVLRNTGSGFFAINDADHKPRGIASVSSSGTTITLTFNFTAKTVRYLHVTPDETFAVQRALVCGASVGLNYAVIMCSQYGQPGAVNTNLLTDPGANLWVHGEFEDSE